MEIGRKTLFGVLATNGIAMGLVAALSDARGYERAEKDLAIKTLEVATPTERIPVAGAAVSIERENGTFERCYTFSSSAYHPLCKVIFYAEDPATMEAFKQIF